VNVAEQREAMGHITALSLKMFSLLSIAGSLGGNVADANQLEPLLQSGEKFSVSFG
jgi:hypothetical protein